MAKKSKKIRIVDNIQDLSSPNKDLPPTCFGGKQSYCVKGLCGWFVKCNPPKS